MPATLPVMDPSQIAVMTPIVKMNKLLLSSKDGILFSMQVDSKHVQIGIADLRTS